MVVTVAFDRVETGVGRARGPSVAEHGGDKSGGEGSGSWKLDGFDPTVMQSSMRHVIVAVVTLVTNVELCEGEGWAHISWVFMIAQGSIESIVMLLAFIG